MIIDIPDPDDFLQELNDKAFADPQCGYYLDRALEVMKQYELKSADWLYCGQ